ncbi:MAG: hypothetical protein AAGJ34_08485 [Pseudomonadota bacterium]
MSISSNMLDIGVFFAGLGGFVLFTSAVLLMLGKVRSFTGLSDPLIITTLHQTERCVEQDIWMSRVCFRSSLVIIPIGLTLMALAYLLKKLGVH